MSEEAGLQKIIIAVFALVFAGAALAQAPVLPVQNGGPVAFEAYITGYSYWDNTPDGTVEISHPSKHRYAGGMGTFSNPITIAVGHQIIDGEDILDFASGTVFYLPRLRKYAIVEDTCGDGPTPQDGPCHSGFEGKPWLDIYVDGVSYEREVSDKCMKKITGVQPVILAPGPNMSVVVGPVTEGGCFVFHDP